MDHNSLISGSIVTQGGEDNYYVLEEFEEATRYGPLVTVADLQAYLDSDGDVPEGMTESLPGSDLRRVTQFSQIPDRYWDGNRPSAADYPILDDLVISLDN
jgi:hypothetical protein